MNTKKKRNKWFCIKFVSLRTEANSFQTFAYVFDTNHMMQLIDKTRKVLNFKPQSQTNNITHCLFTVQSDKTAFGLSLGLRTWFFSDTGTKRTTNQNLQASWSRVWRLFSRKDAFLLPYSILLPQASTFLCAEGSLLSPSITSKKALLLYAPH